VAPLLNHGARVNAQDLNLQTPLPYAAAYAGTQDLGGDDVEIKADLVDALLRWGADETIVDKNGKAAADVLADETEEGNRLKEHVVRVRRLLAHAPADRAWRRRGYLVLCGAHPDRVQQAEESCSAHDGAKRMTCSGSKLARVETAGCGEIAGGSGAAEQNVDEWINVMAKVLGLQEEGIFRMIVRYL